MSCGGGCRAILVWLSAECLSTNGSHFWLPFLRKFCCYCFFGVAFLGAALVVPFFVVPGWAAPAGAFFLAPGVVFTGPDGARRVSTSVELNGYSRMESVVPSALLSRTSTRRFCASTTMFMFFLMRWRCASVRLGS